MADPIMCGECRFYNPIVTAATHMKVGEWCSMLDINDMGPDFFCAYGERNPDIAAPVSEIDALKDELNFTRQFIHQHGLEFELAAAFSRRHVEG